jgi:hypothetical protein
LYAGEKTSLSLCSLSKPTGAGDYAAVCGTWDSSDGIVLLYSDGTCELRDPNADTIMGSALTGVRSIGYGNAICSVVWAAKTNGEFYVRSTSSTATWVRFQPTGALAGKKILSAAVTGGPGVDISTVREYVVLGEDHAAYTVQTADGTTPGTVAKIQDNVAKVTENSFNGNGASRCLLVCKDGSLVEHIGPGDVSKPVGQTTLFPSGRNIVDAFVAYAGTGGGNALFYVTSNGTVYRASQDGTGSIALASIPSGVLKGFGTLSTGTSGPAAWMALPSGT